MSTAMDQRRTTIPRKYEPKQLNPLHHEILRRLLLGDTHKEIATALACTPATVSNIANSGLGREKISIMTSVADAENMDVAMKIRETAPKALQVIQEILENEDASYPMRFKAATDILDRAGHGAVKKLDVKRSATELSIEELDRLKYEAIERAKNAGICVDASIIDVTAQEI